MIHFYIRPVALRTRRRSWVHCKSHRTFTGRLMSNDKDIMETANADARGTRRRQDYSIRRAKQSLCPSLTLVRSAGVVMTSVQLEVILSRQPRDLGSSNL